VKFNFPPIGHVSMGGEFSPESVRELSIGGTTPVADGEWIRVPYPDYTGKCNGALGQVAREMVESALPGGGVRYHQVSIFSGRKAMAPAEAGGDGRIAVAFTDTHIRVQNLSGAAWTGPFWLLLDLRDRLMDFVAGTGNPLTLPLLVPSPASSLRSPTEILTTNRDWSGLDRANAPRSPDGSVLSGNFVSGATTAAPA
jgi:hypothetical protein